MRVTQHNFVLRKKETRDGHWGLVQPCDSLNQMFRIIFSDGSFEEKNVNTDNVNTRNVNSNNVNCTDKSH